jgi:hypothetical protein
VDKTFIEIFSGSSKLTDEFVSRGWNGYSFDIDSRSNSQVICDARSLPLKKIKIDFMWLSPPCNEFSSEFFPWSKTGKEPSLELFKTSLQLISFYQPKLWLIENTKGGDHFVSKFYKPANSIINSWHFWTNVPGLSKFPRKFLNKNSKKIKDPRKRGEIPELLIKHIADQVETFLF